MEEELKALRKRGCRKVCSKKRCQRANRRRN